MEQWIQVVDDNGRVFFLCYTSSWIKIMNASFFEKLGIVETMVSYDTQQAVDFLIEKCEESKKLLKAIIRFLLSDVARSKEDLVRTFELR